MEHAQALQQYRLHTEEREGERAGRESGAPPKDEGNKDPFEKDVELMISTDLAVINEAKVAAQASGCADAMREELQEEADQIISKTLIINAQSLEAIRNDPELAALEAKAEALKEEIENPDQYGQQERVRRARRESCS